MASNAEHLRRWLMGCGAIGGEGRFSVDWLGDGPGEVALITVPSALRWRENVLGERRLLDEQEERFILATRRPFGADTAGNLENLAACRAVAEWISARNAEGAFPEWEGGVVTGVVPTLTGAPAAAEAGTARYQVEIKVTYRIQ